MRKFASILFQILLSALALAILEGAAAAKDDPNFGPAVDAFCAGRPGFEQLPVYGGHLVVGTDPWPAEGQSCAGCHMGYPGLPAGVPIGGYEYGCDTTLYGSKCERQPQFDWYKQANGDFSNFCPTAANTPPVAHAGADQSLPVGSTVTLNGSGSSDADGDPLTYSWTLMAPAGSGASLSDPSAVMPTFMLDLLGDYTAELVVNDGTDASAPDSVSVSTINSAPVANAGPDQSVLVGDAVTLNGSGSSDIDGDALTYSWTLMVSAGSGAALSDPSAVMPAFTADVPGSYVAQLIVSDGSLESAADSVMVSTENSPPVAHAGADQAVYTGDTVTLDGSGSSDVDGDMLAYTWSFTSVPTGSSATLSDPSAVMPAFTADAAGSYVAQLIVHDGQVDSSPDTVVTTASLGNTAPVSDAGPDQAVYVGDSVTLDGSGSSDVDGDTLGYWWSFTSVPTGSNAELSDPSAVMPTFTADVPGSYVAQLTVEDGQVDGSPDTVVIAVSVGNTAPVADAGSDQLADVGDMVMLDGSASSDVDGDTLAYRWSLSAMPMGSNATLSDPGAATTQFVADVGGTYVAQLICNDGAMDSAPDSATVSVRDATPQPPGDAEIDAVWDARKSLLQVKGEGFPSGAVVEILGLYESDVVLLGEAFEADRGDGSWRFELLLTSDEVPCRVEVVDDAGAVYSDDVKRAPGCGQRGSEVPGIGRGRFKGKGKPDW